VISSPWSWTTTTWAACDHVMCALTYFVFAGRSNLLRRTAAWCLYWDLAVGTVISAKLIHPNGLDLVSRLERTLPRPVRARCRASALLWCILLLDGPAGFARPAYRTFGI
jgi:hypothetical protein